MAGHRIILNNGGVIFLDYADAEGSAVVNGKKWSWEFHEWGGPTFLKANGEPRQCQNPTVKGVWEAFEVWHQKYCQEKVDKSSK